MITFLSRLALPLLILLAVSACSGISSTPAGEVPNAAEERRQSQGKLFGDIELGTGGRDSGGGGTGIGVNAFLWRASLDTLSFLPLASADPFGGVVITDWYAPPESPDERFKVTVYLLGEQLRSDGLRVAVFRQVRSPTGGWDDFALSEDTANGLADAILTRARELRIASDSR